MADSGSAVFKVFIRGTPGAIWREITKGDDAFAFEAFVKKDDQ
jgi:hypothetical protein